MAHFPAELAGYAQWVVWRYEDTDDGKPTKVPYCPHTGRHANVNDPSTWGTLPAAREVAEFAHFDGLGFVLTSNDPFAFIDLDATDDDEKTKRQIAVYEAFDSYAERSPSGSGLHIIVRGHVPSGRKRSAIELYSDRRFMTMTGDVFRDAPIADYHDLLNRLWSEMAPPSQHSYSVSDAAQSEEDGVIYDRAATAGNGEKFIALYNGQWQDYYPSQSEADFALVNIIAFYSQNREQITRMFRASMLGQRSKAQRDDYMGWMLNRTFDRMLPPVDISAIRAQIEATIRAPQPEPGTAQAEAAAEPRLDPVSREVVQIPSACPPGLLGEIAQFIYAAAPRPVEVIALGAAVGLLAGICGRAYNISATGLNQYVLVLAGTGTGKEGIKSGIDRLMARVVSIDGAGVPAAGNFIGPGEIASPQALQKYLVGVSPSFVSIVGEVGLWMRQLLDPRAPSHFAGLRRAFLSLYSKSGKGQVLGSLIYSDKEKSTATMTAPAFSLLGESTQERFFEALDESMISEGLLPRFSIIEYDGKRPCRNKDHAGVQPPQSLVDRLGALCAHSLMLNHEGQAVTIEMDEPAQAMLDDFDEHCDDRINQGDRDVNKQFWNRAHLKALKLAGLVAVGINPYAPLVTADVAQWAINFVVAEVRNMLSRFESGNVGNDNHETEQIKALKRVAREYLKAKWETVAVYGGTAMTHAHGIVPHAVLSKRLLPLAPFKRDRSGATRAVHRTVQTLIDNGTLAAVGPQERAKMIANGWMGNSSAKMYAVVEPDKL